MSSEMCETHWIERHESITRDCLFKNYNLLTIIAVGNNKINNTNSGTDSLIYGFQAYQIAVFIRDLLPSIPYFFSLCCNIPPTEFDHTKLSPVKTNVK